jgi:hypothetical protein
MLWVGSKRVNSCIACSSEKRLAIVLAAFLEPERSPARREPGRGFAEGETSD